MYALEQGGVEEFILKNVAREGLPIPKRIANAPILKQGLELYFEAFFSLCSCRVVGMSLGEIPWISIRQYCVMVGLCEEQTEDMHFFIQQMDREYLKFMKNK